MDWQFGVTGKQIKNLLGKTASLRAEVFGMYYWTPTTFVKASDTYSRFLLPTSIRPLPIKICQKSDRDQKFTKL